MLQVQGLLFAPCLSLIFHPLLTLAQVMHYFVPFGGYELVVVFGELPEYSWLCGDVESVFYLGDGLRLIQPSVCDPVENVVLLNY